MKNYYSGLCSLVVRDSIKIQMGLRLVGQCQFVPLLQVMVMAEDAAIRANRLRLLHSLAELCSQVADLSRLQATSA